MRAPRLASSNRSRVSVKHNRSTSLRAFLVPAKNAEGFPLEEDLQNAISNAIGKAGFKTWRRDHLQRAEQEYLAVYTGVRSTANFQRRWLMNTQAMSEAEADAYVAAAVDKVVQQLRSGNRDAS